MNSEKSDGQNATRIGKVVIDVAPVVIPFVGKAIDEITRLLSSKDESTTIPSLCNKEFSIKLKEAVEVLKVADLTPIPSELTMKEADPKYKDCFAFQVVGLHSEYKRKAPCKSPVIVKYITQEVIDETQRKFDELEKQKAETKRVKAEKREQQIGQAQKMIIDAAASAKDGFEKILPHRKHEATESDKES